MINPVPTIVTDRGSVPEDGSIARTPLGRRDVIVRVMTPVAQVLVRAIRTYLQSLLGFLTLGLAGKPVADNIGVVITPDSFLGVLGVAAGLALAPTIVAVLHNAAELLARLDERFPKARA